MPAPNTIADFWRQVRKTSSCWYWIGAGSNGERYGRFGWNGRRIKAHRFSWSLHNGPIPNRLHVLHRCDNGLCVHPKHLFIGTHRDNMLDMFAKRRRQIVRGSQQGAAKLTERKVLCIRRLYRRGHIRQVDLARRFGVVQTGISKIILRKSWNHI
jgi:hypothetical protein